MSVCGQKEKKTSAMADAKQGKAPEDFYNGSGQSRVVLAKPRLGGFGSSTFASSSSNKSNPFGSVLRPSQLKPTVNPFFKATDPADLDENKKEVDSEDRLKKPEEPEVPKFVPLGSNSSARSGSQVPAPAQSTSSSSSASFVFGQNLSARVMMDNVNNGESNNGDAKDDHSSSNGTELLFSSAAASVKDNNQEESSASSGESGGPGLAAAAAEYERSHARPPPPAASYNLTGEEGETNVMQISCRLFAWETGSWRERGRGVLRLNDAAGGGGARLVARVAGSLRVVLNTKVWSDMVADRAGTKSLRITAADAHNQVKLFLIMGAPLDITQLHRALSTRIAASKRTVPASTCSINVTSQQAAERLEAAADDAEYLDKIDSDNPDLTKDDQHDRLDSPVHKTEEYESNVDGMKEDHEARALKRKEQAEDDTETSPKRQCPNTTE